MGDLNSALADHDAKIELKEEETSGSTEGPVVTNGYIAESKESEEEASKKEREAFLKDPEQIAGALQLASTLIDAMGEGRWFTLTQICKRTKMDRMQAINKLKFIQMFDHATVRTGDDTDKLKYRGEPLWTIALTPESKIKAIDGIIEETLAHIANLNRLYLHKKIWLRVIAEGKKADPIS